MWANEYQVRCPYCGEWFTWWHGCPKNNDKEVHRADATKAMRKEVRKDESKDS